MKLITNKYYFSVEGETEYWYLKWLEKEINNSNSKKYKVSFECKVQKSPEKFVKTIKILNKTTVYHICDIESQDEIHQKTLCSVLDSMKKATNCGKTVKYVLGYSNFTFELWLILHKLDFNKSVSHRKNYLIPINKAFNEKFESLDEYKEEKNFKHCLEKLTLDDVIDAINRSKIIMENNKNNGYKPIKYGKFEYYKENPSLTIWEIIHTILIDCGIISKS